MEETLEQQLRNRLATAIADGMDYGEIQEKFGLSLSTIRETTKQPEFEELVFDLVYNKKMAAQYRLVSSATAAVDDLISFLGHPNVEPREELAAINLILSYCLRPEDAKAREATVKKLKGLSKQTVENIKKQILGVE